MDITKITKPARKLLPLKKCGAVIVAAGSASRMGGIDKVMAPLDGEPMIVRTVRNFQNCDAISEIVVVTRPDLIESIQKFCTRYPKLKAVVAGGKSRQESLSLGLDALSKENLGSVDEPLYRSNQAGSLTAVTAVALLRNQFDR